MRALLPSYAVVTKPMQPSDVETICHYRYRRACHGAWVFAHHTFAHFSVLVRNLSFRAALHASEGPPCKVTLAKPLNPKQQKPKKRTNQQKTKKNYKKKQTKKNKKPRISTLVCRIPTSVEILGFFFGLFGFWCLAAYKQAFCL